MQKLLDRIDELLSSPNPNPIRSYAIKCSERAVTSHSNPEILRPIIQRIKSGDKSVVTESQLICNNAAKLLRETIEKGVNYDIESKDYNATFIIANAATFLLMGSELAMYDVARRSYVSFGIRV